MEYPQSARPALPAALAVWPSFVLAHLASKANALFEEQLRSIGLRSRQYAILALLADQGPQSQHALGQQLTIDRTSMVALIDELERLGLVQRRPAPGDRRAYALNLTEDGEVALAEAGKFVIAVEKEIFEALSTAERRQLQELLRRLI